MTLIYRARVKRAAIKKYEISKYIRNRIRELRDVEATVEPRPGDGLNGLLIEARKVAPDELEVEIGGSTWSKKQIRNKKISFQVVCARVIRTRGDHSVRVRMVLQSEKEKLIAFSEKLSLHEAFCYVSELFIHKLYMNSECDDLRGKWDTLMANYKHPPTLAKA